MKRSLPIAALMLGSAACLRRWFNRPLPQTRGRIRLEGLLGPVEIVRDRWAIPHLYASNLDDLLFAQGFVHAQDRLWQMELHRRLGHGRLAEILGAAAFPTDRLTRTLGVARAAAADLSVLPVQDLNYLNAYARGVNAFLEANHSRLPLEFSLLHFSPAPWQPLDSLVWAKFMSLAQSFNWDSEILHSAVIDRLGPERAARLTGGYPVENPTILPGHSPAWLADQVLAAFQQGISQPRVSVPRGMSNSWAVAGSKTQTGLPLLASDPHLPLQLPNFWYENHLDCPELQATGVSLPGAPGIIIGHNGDIAWGITTSFTDTQDLFIEKLDPANPTNYDSQGGWVAAVACQEEIQVRGEPRPRSLQVLITRHGPFVTELLPLSSCCSGYGLAFQWAGAVAGNPVGALLALNHAQSWDDFSSALDGWHAPVLNMVYADREGNIGYRLAGRVPVRRHGIGQVPMPGWTGDYDWEGWVPSSELPRSLNPADGAVVTANNAVAGREYHYFLSAETMNGYRAGRIRQVLSNQVKLSLADFARLQTDQFCAPARPFCALLVSMAAELLREPPLQKWGETARSALDTLDRWDYNLDERSVGGAIYEVTQHFALRRVFHPWLGELFKHFAGVGLDPVLLPLAFAYYDKSLLVLTQVLESDEREWFKAESGRAMTRHQVLAAALDDALSFLTGALGPDVSGWEWGKIHRAGFGHPLGRLKPLNLLFDRGPFAYGGDANTVWQAGFVPALPIPAAGGISASWRQLIDLSNWDRCRAVLAGGQSGHPASEHYADQLELWLDGRSRPMLWNRGRVNAFAAARLVLEPPTPGIDPLR